MNGWVVRAKYIAICEEDNSGGSYQAFCFPANIEVIIMIVEKIVQRPRPFSRKKACKKGRDRRIPYSVKLWRWKSLTNFDEYMLNRQSFPYQNFALTKSQYCHILRL